MSDWHYSWYITNSQSQKKVNTVDHLTAGQETWLCQKSFVWIYLCMKLSQVVFLNKDCFK